MNITIHGVDETIQALKDYAVWIERKADEIAKRLAEMGVVLVAIEYSAVPYRGIKDVDLSVEHTGQNIYTIVAKGKAVLILEFGAGVTYGYGHPQAGQFGMGPTTYPGQTHAADPNGWWLPKSAGGGHTYGNPPSMAMYLTAKELRKRIEEVAKEVFSQ